MENNKANNGNPEEETVPRWIINGRRWIGCFWNICWRIYEMMKPTNGAMVREDEQELPSLTESAKRSTSQQGSFCADMISELIYKFPTISNKTERIEKLRLRLSELQQREEQLTMEERSRIFRSSFSEHISSLDERIRDAKVAFADELGLSARYLTDTRNLYENPKEMQSNAERLAILAHHNFDHVLDKLSILINRVELEFLPPKEEPLKPNPHICFMDDFEISEPESDPEWEDCEYAYI